MSLFVYFISLLIVAQHVSGNHVPIIRSWRLRDVIALCWYAPWLQEGCQVRLAIFIGYAVHISIVKSTRCTSVSTLFYFGMILYMFRTVFPSIIRSSRLYIQQPNRYCCLFASKQTAVSVWHMPVSVCTVFNSWWWTERPFEKCRVSFQNEINLIH